MCCCDTPAGQVPFYRQNPRGTSLAPAKTYECVFKGVEMPAKKPAARKVPRGKKKIGLTSAIGPKATTALVICVLAGGIALGARQQQQQMKDKDAATTMAPETASNEGGAVSASAPSKAMVSTSISNATVAPSAKSPASRAVTVTGCLEKSDEGYRLKDTSGVAAPKARSWKSGFLKKGSASVDIVDASHSLALNSQVGHRVAVTGPLTDREIQAESVRRIAASCKAN